MDLVKKEFVRRILQDEGERLISAQTIAINKRLQYHTGELLNGRSFKVVGGDQDMSGTFTLSHPIKERFLDMKRTVRRKRTAGFRVRRGYPIHNRIIFGHYGQIAKRLAVEFTDELAGNIREELSQSGPNFNVDL